MIKHIKHVETHVSYFDPLRWSWTIQGPNRKQASVQIKDNAPFTLNLDMVDTDLIIRSIDYGEETLWNMSIPPEFSSAFQALMATQEDQSRLIGTVVDILLNMQAAGNKFGVALRVDVIQGAASVTDSLTEQDNPPVSIADIPRIALTRYADVRGWLLLEFEDDTINSSGSSVIRYTALTYPPA